MTDWDTFWRLLAQLTILCGVLAFLISVGAALFISISRERRSHRQLDQALKRTRREP